MNRSSTDAGSLVRQVYDLLYERYGPQGWWPAETKLEVVLGAILVQSTAWGNAAKALDAIREAGVLDVVALARLSEGEIGELVRSSGFYSVKARRVKAFVEHVMERHGGDLDSMFDQDATELRRELLGIHGIGEETADCIVLYAAGKPTFVIDEYTRRIVGRLGVGPGGRGTYWRLPTAVRGGIGVGGGGVWGVSRFAGRFGEGRLSEEPTVPRVCLEAGVRIWEEEVISSKVTSYGD